MRRLLLVGIVVLVSSLTDACGGGAVLDKPRPTIEQLLERANNGDIDALFDLGNRYSNGDGIARDNVLAYKWFGLAAEFLNNEKRYQALRMQQLLDSEMFRHQIAEAERLGRIWKDDQRSNSR